MKLKVLGCLVLCLSLFSISTAYGLPQEVDPEAKKLFKEMCDYMASLKSYSVTSNVFENRVFPNGEKLQFHRVSKSLVQRPDKARSETLGDASNTLSIINGKNFALLDQTVNTYQLLAVPIGLDSAVDFLLEKFDLNVPTADLIKADPFGAIFPNIITGTYVQAVEMEGKLYHHLAFRQLQVDWQVWIADGDKPLPSRIVITDKTQYGNPQFMICYEDWNTHPDIKAASFEFSPPEGASQAEILSSAEESIDNPDPAEAQ